MLPAVLGLASGSILLLSRSEERSTPPFVAQSLQPRDIEVPLSLTRKQWFDFLRVSICGDPSTVSPSFRLGSFGMTVRRLCDLGVMSNPRVIQYGGWQVWDADWEYPTSLGAFQSDAILQYEIFVASVKRYSKSIPVTEAIGKEIDGVKVSQSGAIMVAHRAGLPGLISWLQFKEVRAKFSNNTTSFFQRANSIF